MSFHYLPQHLQIQILFNVSKMEVTGGSRMMVGNGWIASKILRESLLTDDVFYKLLLLAYNSDAGEALVAAARGLQLTEAGRGHRLFEEILSRMLAAVAAEDAVQGKSRRLLNDAYVDMARANCLCGIQRVDAAVLPVGRIIDRAIVNAAEAASVDVLRWLLSDEVILRVEHTEQLIERAATNAASNDHPDVLDILHGVNAYATMYGAASMISFIETPHVLRWMMACGTACPSFFAENIATYCVKIFGPGEEPELYEMLRWTNKIRTGVCEAGRQGRFDVAERMMREFDNEQLLVFSDNPHLAATTVSLLLERKARLEEALVVAARDADTTAAGLLLSAGARVTDNAVVAAAAGGSVDLLETLLLQNHTITRRPLLVAMAACSYYHTCAHDGCYKALLRRAHDQGVHIEDLDVMMELTNIMWGGPGSPIWKYIYHLAGPVL